MCVDPAHGDLRGFIPLCAFGFDLPPVQDIGQMLQFLVRDLIHGPVLDPKLTDPQGKSGREMFREHGFDSGPGPEGLLPSEMFVEIKVRKEVNG